MSIPGAGNPLLLGGAGGYKIERSLRFNSADSAYLSRTPASAGNRKTWTWSGWVKRSALQTGTSNTYMQLFTAGTGPSNRDVLFFDTDTDDTLAFYSANGIAGTATLMFRTNAVFRDASAWMHIMLAVDTTQATAANRVKLYVNGSEQTFSTATYPSQNAEGYINLNNAHYIATHPPLSEYFSGYITEVHFIDGQALTPSSFGGLDTNGIWQPIKYTDTYGTNGFQLKFADNSNNTATTLGKDTSPNGNNWTPNNLSVTAGAGNDSLVDSPTNYGADTGAGGEVRGNYCTLNPLGYYNSEASVSNGALTFTSAISNWTRVAGTMAVSSGKWYWEYSPDNSREQTGGIQLASASSWFSGNTNWVGYDANSYGYYSANGNKYNNNVPSAYGASYTTGDIIGVALDLSAGTLTFYKNGVSQGVAYSGLSGTFLPAFSLTTNLGANVCNVNFGQRPFAYTAPSGFKALCTQNLPVPTITKPSTVMDVALWTGNDSARSITGLGFNPDLVWIKGRSSATDHALYDSVRGAEKRLESNNTDAEVTSDGGVTAFNSDGFSLGTLAQVNTNTATYAGWTWDAGSSTVTNTDGSISSQVRANASAGFSVVTYTGNGITGATVGHGLGATPSMIILKRRDAASTNWYTYHSVIDATGALALNATNGTITSSNFWNNTSPTSTVVTISAAGGTEVNGNGGLYLLYCFAPVAGYSAFGSYTGNGSADGPMVFTNMRPRWIMLKRTDSTSNWTIIDTAREGYNVDNDPLYPNLSDAEGTADLADILSNGFKLRSTDASVNANAGTYVYACFAESPFALARAR